MTALDLFNYIQTAIAKVLGSDLGALNDYAIYIYSGWAAIALGTGFVKTIYSEESFTRNIWSLVRVFGLVLFFYSLLLYWNRPIPFGPQLSVPDMVETEAGQVSSGLDEDLSEKLIYRVQQADAMRKCPDLFTMSLRAGITYTLDTILLVSLQALAFLITGYGMGVAALARLMGPLGIMTSIIPGADSIFNGWWKWYIQYAFFYRVMTAGTMLVVLNIVSPSLDNFPGFQSIAAQIASFPFYVMFLLLGIALVLSIPLSVSHMMSGISSSKWDGWIAAKVSRPLFA